MIFYQPTSGDVQTSKIDFSPRTCFIATQLGIPIPEKIDLIRKDIGAYFEENKIGIVDANSQITGKDFLLKIWKMIYAVPLIIAIVDKEMPTLTQCNIFYEIGVAQAMGKETVVIKTKGTPIPSDFIRTEYIEYDLNFKEKLEKYIESFFKQAEYYQHIADQLEKNPLLAIDYLRRAYLISGNILLKEKVKKILQEVSIRKRAKNSVEILLSDF